MAANNSNELGKKTANAGKTITLGNGNKREYNAEGTSYSDYRPDGSQAGAGLSGTENWGRDENGNSVSSGGSGRGSSSRSSNSYLSNLINSQYDQALKAKVAALQKARDTSVSGYNQNISALPGEYQPLRNQADLRGMQNSRAINETMAAQGNWRSGANQTAQTANNASTANAISGFDKQQQDAVDRLKQAIAQVQAGYQSDVASTTADTEAQRLAALIGQANTDRSFNQADKQFNMNYGLQRDQLSSQNNQWNQTFDYNKTRDSVADTQWGKTFDANQQMQQWQQQFQEKGFSADEAYRAAQLKMAQDQFNSELGYKYSALAKSGSSKKSSGNGVTANANATTISYGKDLVEALQSGATIPEINAIIARLEKSDPRVDGDWLRTQANSFPIDNWQYKAGY